MAERTLITAVERVALLGLLDALDATEAERDAALADVAQLQTTLAGAGDTYRASAESLQRDAAAALAEVARLRVGLMDARRYLGAAVGAGYVSTASLPRTCCATVRPAITETSSWARASASRCGASIKALAAIDAALAEPQSVEEACQHENTVRGGAIWTRCEDCGRRWAEGEPQTGGQS